MCRKLIVLASVVLVVGLGGKAWGELVARYSFDDGTASDSAYYCEDAEGTFYGDAKVVDDPCRGLVLELDGTGDYVRVENNDVAEFSTESFSYSFWAKTSFVGDWFYFWKGVDYSGADTDSDKDDLHGVNCYHDDSDWVRFSLYNYSGPGGELKSRTEVPGVNCVDGTWVHIACVRDVSKVGEELRFYVNGKLESTPSTEYPNPGEDECKDISNPGYLNIGCSDRGYPLDVNSNPTLFFFGRIDDFRAYNHALSEQELEWLANDMTDPNLSSDPSPRDSAQNVCPGVSLSWTAGDNVVDHNVYFGTSLSDVNASATAYILHHPSTSFSPALEYGKTYYWRIEEVNPGHVDSPWEGSIWRFTTNDGNAFDPYPADGQSQVPLNPTLHWTPGCLAASHDFYYGTDYDEVNDADGGSEPNVYYEDLGDVNSYDACTPDYSTYHYWRVDEVNGLTEWRGKVLTFKSESSIFDPNLRVWYKLDETEDTVAADSSGREYDGDVDGNSVWDANGYYDGCLSFDDDTAVIVPMGVLGEISKEITIAVWLNTGIEGGDDNVVCAAGAEWEPNYVRVAVPDDDHDVYWRAGNENETNDVMPWDGGNPKAWKGEWNHFAFVKDENAGKMQIYLNGLRVAEQTGTSSGTLAGVRNRRFKIGAETDDASGYKGRIDDYRLYDRALTADEIAAIFRGGDLASAWGPSPYNGEDEVPYDVELIWKPGDYAADPNAHEVYFGTNFNGVNDANNSWPIGTSVYKGAQDLDSNSYDPPGLLDLDITYYWRIDEVNDANNDRWKGNIWKFTVANFITIDDFEKYDVGYADEQPGSWESTYETGSAIEFGDSGWGPVRGGKMSMIYWYDNTWDWGPGYYSEASTEALSPTDWNDFDIKLLTLWFYGAPDNDATYLEQMYVGVKDSNGCYAELRYGDNGSEDMNDIKIETWQRWDIPLTCFSDSNFAAVPNDVNLVDVEKLIIGFGISGGGTLGGEGTVYFDDIRLYPPMCRPEKVKPEVDLNYDCIVDFGDVEIMAEEWLDSDVNIGVVEEPDPCVLHYKFDESSGSSVTDYSTNNYDGVVMLQDSSPTDAFWEPNGMYGDCIRFEHKEKKYCVDVPNDVFNNHITNQITISVWVNWVDPGTMPGETNQLFSVHGGPAGTVWDYNGILGIETAWADDKEVRFWDANGDTDGDIGIKYGVNEPDWSGGWNHYAFVKDVSVIPGKLRIYHNGELVKEGDSNSPMRLPADNAWLGMATDEPNGPHDNYKGEWHDEYTGLLDDFRIYNYALSETEIGYLASSGTGIVTVQSVANLYNDEDLGERAVNLRDFAKLAKGWLEVKLWPE